MEDKMSINRCFTNTVFIWEFNNTKIGIHLYLKFLWIQAGLVLLTVLDQSQENNQESSSFPFSCFLHVKPLKTYSVK